MKCIVTAIFKDKYDGSYTYHPGDEIDWTDQDRIDDCISRGLIMPAPEEAKPKKTTRKTTIKQ